MRTDGFCFDIIHFIIAFIPNSKVFVPMCYISK